MTHSDPGITASVDREVVDTDRDTQCQYHGGTMIITIRCVGNIYQHEEDSTLSTFQCTPETIIIMFTSARLWQPSLSTRWRGKYAHCVVVV